MCGAVGKFDRAALVEMLGRVLEAHHFNKHDLEVARHWSGAA